MGLAHLCSRAFTINARIALRTARANHSGAMTAKAPRPTSCGILNGPPGGLRTDDAAASSRPTDATATGVVQAVATQVSSGSTSRRFGDRLSTRLCDLGGVGRPHLLDDSEARAFRLVPCCQALSAADVTPDSVSPVLQAANARPCQRRYRTAIRDRVEAGGEITANLAGLRVVAPRAAQCGFQGRFCRSFSARKNESGCRLYWLGILGLAVGIAGAVSCGPDPDGD